MTGECDLIWSAGEYQTLGLSVMPNREFLTREKATWRPMLHLRDRMRDSICRSRIVSAIKYVAAGPISIALPFLIEVYTVSELLVIHPSEQPGVGSSCHHHGSARWLSSVAAP